MAHVTVIDGTTTVWSGSASMLEIRLWVVGPPLVLWIAWMMLRPRRAVGDGEALGGMEPDGVASGARRSQLPQPDARSIAAEIRDRRDPGRVRGR